MGSIPGPGTYVVTGVSNGSSRCLGYGQKNHKKPFSQGKLQVKLNIDNLASEGGRQNLLGNHWTDQIMIVL